MRVQPIPKHTAHPTFSHTKDPYPARKPRRDAPLKADKEATPLSASVSVPHSLGALYPTDRKSRVDRNSPALAALVACPWTSRTLLSMAAWFSGNLPFQKRHAWTRTCCRYKSPTFSMPH